LSTGKMYHSITIMKKLNPKEAKAFALEIFRQLPDLEREWNTVHSESIIVALELLSAKTDRLIALAWVHDIGKVKSRKDHAKYSAYMLKERFNLELVDIDCILNHGSSGKPQTEEGMIFRYADGLSVFIPASIRFLQRHENSYQNIRELYDKYRERYDDPKVLEILDGLWNRTQKKG